MVEETARTTEERISQDEGEIERINGILRYILDHGGMISASFTYFSKDQRKSGGQYLKKVGKAVKADEIKRRLIFSDKTFLLLDDIVEIELL